VKRPLLVVYDVFNDHRRDHLRTLLTPLADRIQQSAWIIPAHCAVDPDHLAAALTPATGPADRVGIHAPCPQCVIDSRWLPAGQPHRLLAPRVWTVI
jgi:CRISPR/Cas system-associated endoribonuclease Cas2